MSRAAPSLEDLNAYVDGELSASDAAAVARALANDKTLADTVATLSRLKAATQENLEPFALPPRPPVRRPRHRAAIAAALAAVVMIAAVLSWQPWGGSSQRPQWLAGAWQTHKAWAQSQAATSPSAVESGVILAALHWVGPDAFLPDLSDARLSLSRLEIVTIPDGVGEALHMGYLGTRGCQVSLLVIPGGGGLTDTLARYNIDGAQSYAWRGPRNGYLLLAEGMDEHRLALLAETVRRASLERHPLDLATRTALRESREKSVPCLS